MNGLVWLSHIRWRVLAVCCFCVTSIYFGLVIGSFYLSDLVVYRFGDNANWQATQALAAGNHQRAIAVASERVKAEEFDFTARRLLAQALIQDNQAADAVDILLRSLAIGQSITRRSTVYSRGYNPAADYQYLAAALYKNGQVTFAGEMERAAADAAVLHSTGHMSDFAEAEAPELDFDLFPPSDMPRFDLLTLELPEGAAFSDSGAIAIARSTSVETSFRFPDAPSAFLWIQVRGGRPFGFGSLLQVALNGEELIRIYANHTRPRWVQVPLEQSLSTGTMQLTARFLNDAYDPITRADRNVEILAIGMAASQ